MVFILLPLLKHWRHVCCLLIMWYHVACHCYPCVRACLRYGVTHPLHAESLAFPHHPIANMPYRLWRWLGEQFCTLFLRCHGRGPGKLNGWRRILNFTLQYDTLFLRLLFVCFKLQIGLTRHTPLFNFTRWYSYQKGTICLSKYRNVKCAWTLSIIWWARGI